MKRNYIYILFILLGISFITCTDEDNFRWDLDELEKTFVPYVKLSDDSPAGFDPANLSGASVTFTVDLRQDQGQELDFEPDNVESIDVMVTYDNLLEPLETPEKVVYQTINTWPQDMTVSVGDFVNVLSSFSSIDDVVIGDKFTISERIHLTDGRTIDDIDNEETVMTYDSLGNEAGEITFQTYHDDIIINESGRNYYNIDLYVNCQDDLSGTYTCETTGQGGAAATGVVGEYSDTRTVTVTAAGGGVYEFDKAFGGFYDYFYAPFYGGGDISGNYLFLCENVFAGPGLNDPWGLIAEVSGSIDFSTGVITITWSNLFGTVFMGDDSLNDSATMVLTPQ